MPTVLSGGKSQIAILTCNGNQTLMTWKSLLVCLLLGRKSVFFEQDKGIFHTEHMQHYLNVIAVNRP